MSVVSWHRIADDLTKQVRELQADLAACKVEIAALKEYLEAARGERDGRRCDECDSREGASHYCLLWTIHTPDEHYCRDWTPRPTEGGDRG